MVEIVNRPYAKAFETFATARPEVGERRETEELPPGLAGVEKSANVGAR